jgi:hypothetical protein
MGEKKLTGTLHVPRPKTVTSSNVVPTTSHFADDETRLKMDLINSLSADKQLKKDILRAMEEEAEDTLSQADIEAYREALVILDKTIAAKEQLLVSANKPSNNRNLSEAKSLISSLIMKMVLEEFENFHKRHPSHSIEEQNVLNKKEPRNEETTVYYHGTSVRLQPGSLVLPPKETGKQSEKGRKKNLDVVFFTKDPRSALIYAGRAAKSLGGSPVVYAVEPQGPLGVLNDQPGTTVFFAPYAKVIRPISKEELSKAGVGKLKEYIETLVSEVLRGFNLDKFKKIAAKDVRAIEPRNKYDRAIPPWDLDIKYTQHPEIEYAKSVLPKIGEGSSRITFALSGGKVLKIAKNQAGLGQNETEVSVYTNSRNTQFITKIFDFAPDYKWIISELVKPISEDKFEQLTKLSADEFKELLNSATSLSTVEDGLSFLTRDKIIEINQDMQEVLQDIEKYKKQMQHENNKLASKNKEPLPDVVRKAIISRIDKYKAKIEALEKEVTKLQAWKQGLLAYNAEKAKKGIQFVLDLQKFIKENQLIKADIYPEHFGVTIDGQLRLYDYGFDLAVHNKHY